MGIGPCHTSVVRLTTWNIRAGGGVRTPRIAEALLEESPDVAVLTEYRTVPGVRLMEALKGRAYHRLETLPPKNQNGVCVLSTHAIESYSARMRPKSHHRWLPMRISDSDVSVLAIHIPNQTEIWNKREFWDCVEKFGMRHTKKRSLIVGDLNSALDEDCEGDVGPPCLGLQRLLDAGWVDAWREHNGTAKEYTWYSHLRNGFRLDYCLASPLLAKSLVGARLRHDVRTSGLSDHSMLTVELDL